MSSSATKKLNLPLSAEMHEAIFTESRSLGVPATRVVRSVLEAWLKERQRIRRLEEIRRFAEAHAGSELDIDHDLEAAAEEEFDRISEDEDATR
jgi:tRNA(Ser,Leu) C12 N-acetylase TAN1